VSHQGTCPVEYALTGPSWQERCKPPGILLHENLPCVTEMLLSQAGVPSFRNMENVTGNIEMDLIIILESFCERHVVGRYRHRDVTCSTNLAYCRMCASVDADTQKE
jgi:hypothetical protein